MSVIDIIAVPTVPLTGTPTATELAGGTDKVPVYAPPPYVIPVLTFKVAGILNDVDVYNKKSVPFSL